MRCKEVMRMRVRALKPSTTVQGAAQRMRNDNLGYLPVCDDDGQVLGVLTDRDLALRVVAEDRPASTRVDAVMSRDVVTCHPEDPIRVAEARMGQWLKSRILCVDGRGRLCGVLSLTDLAWFERSARVRRTLRHVTEREVDL